ncbi:MAG: (d)CMP kinase [Pseudomonadota bacterium]
MSDPIPVITIDGPSGSGKGTVTHRTAAALGFHILDSGALYRLVGLAAAQRGLDLDDERSVAALVPSLDIRFAGSQRADDPLDVFLGGTNVSAEIRTDEAGVHASRVAPMAAVRAALQDVQHSFRRDPGLVADGRDMGTVVFPDAPVKIFLTASAEARAERRHKQLKHKGLSVNLAALLQSIQDRDERDRSREVAPLRPASDAVAIDSTDMSIDDVVDAVLKLARQRL